MDENQKVPDTQEIQPQPEGTDPSTPEPVDEIDLNILFPDAEKDLNALFPDEESRLLLKKITKNKKDLHTLNERFQYENEEQDTDDSASPQ